MKKFFTAKYWKIKRANWRIIKFRYFYSWQNIVKMFFAFVFVMPIFFTFVSFPKWVFNWLEEFIGDNMPGFLKFDENPEWVRKYSSQRRDFMLSLKDWD